MSEADVIQQTAVPLTVESLAEQFTALGMAAGQTVLVHSAMSRLGWVVGGPEAVILALLQVLGPQGTLMMPTHSAQRTDPANWHNPPVPPEWVPIIRAHMPLFNPATTPTREMGALAELFRAWPGIVRSAHPIGSFAALGPNAHELTANDDRLDSMFSDQSPIGKLYALDGHVLLLGVGHGNNTSLHLAENRAEWPGKTTIAEGTTMLVDGVPQWVAYDMLRLEDNDFETIGADYEAKNGLHPGKVGNATTRFFQVRPMIDFAVQWMTLHRGP